MSYIQFTGKRPTEDDPDTLEDFTEGFETTSPARVTFMAAGGYQNIELGNDPEGAGASKVEILAEDPNAEPEEPVAASSSSTSSSSAS